MSKSKKEKKQQEKEKAKTPAEMGEWKPKKTSVSLEHYIRRPGTAAFNKSTRLVTLTQERKGAKGALASLNNSALYAVPRIGSAQQGVWQANLGEAGRSASI